MALLTKIKLQFLRVILLALPMGLANNIVLASELEDKKTGIVMPRNLEVIRDFAYGSHSMQRMDIYKPKNAKQAPVILMLYGGGYYGNEQSKSERLVYINKVARWIPKGFIVISAATRNLPESDAYTQVLDLAQAVFTAQQMAEKWGGDPNKFFIMGHSSGGHLISLLCAKPSLVTNLGGRRWLAGISLDSSSMDIVKTMQGGHAGFFDAAFGHDPEKWPSASPIQQLSKQSIPLLMACSTQRGDMPCKRAEAYAEQANQYNVIAHAKPLDLNHGEINDFLGLDNAYTKEVEAFMASFDQDVARLLDMN